VSTLPEPADGGRDAEVAEAVHRVRGRLVAACVAAGRPEREVTLIGVTKTFPVRDARRLLDAGVAELGESREQEGGPKAAALPSATWHFLGRLQANKAARVAGWADVLHTLDRAELVARLARTERPPAVLVQVNLDGDPARGGVPPADVVPLADAAAAAGLVVRGVMAVAPREAVPERAFEALARVSARLRASYDGATWISAGMSGDLEAAVAHGATHVRIGSALLGERPPPV